MKYKIQTTCTITCTTQVETNSKDEALDQAMNRTLQPAPHNVQGDINSEFVIQGFDGEPDIDGMEVFEA